MYKLTQLEFRAIAIFLHAKKIPELALNIGKLNDNEYKQVINELKNDGLMVSSEKEYAYHLNENLILTMIAVVTPKSIVVVRDVDQKISIMFYLQGKHITKIGLSKNNVLVENIPKLNIVAKQALSFLGKTKFGIVGVLEIKKGKVVTKEHIEIKGNTIAFSSVMKTEKSLEVVEEFISNRINN